MVDEFCANLLSCTSEVTGGFFAESHPAFKKNRAEYENSCKKLLAAQHPTAVADYVSLGSGFTDETAGDVLVSCGALGADGKMTYHTKEVSWHLFVALASFLVLL